jgi:uncharacterized phosphatase
VSIPLSPLSISAACLLLLGIALMFYFMRPRRFYLVRHGETVLNAEHIKQGRDGDLSETGRAQAETVGRYLKRFRIKRILTSTYPRARETAAIINTHLDAPIEPVELLVERRNPSEVINKRTTDPHVEQIMDQIERAYHDDEYRYSDEENFLDLRERAHKCLSFLTRQYDSEIAVITHHVFLKMLIAYLLYRGRLHASDFVKLSFFNYSDNAGITVVEFHPWKYFTRTHGWEVVTYNEQPEMTDV